MKSGSKYDTTTVGKAKSLFGILGNSVFSCPQPCKAVFCKPMQRFLQFSKRFGSGKAHPTTKPVSYDEAARYVCTRNLQNPECAEPSEAKEITQEELMQAYLAWQRKQRWGCLRSMQRCDAHNQPALCRAARHLLDPTPTCGDNWPSNRRTFLPCRGLPVSSAGAGWPAAALPSGDAEGMDVDTPQPRWAAAAVPVCRRWPLGVP